MHLVLSLQFFCILDLSLELARVSVSQSSPQKPPNAEESDITRQPSVDTLTMNSTVQPAVKTGLF